MFVRVLFTARRGGFVPYDSVTTYVTEFYEKVPEDVSVTQSVIEPVPASDGEQRRTHLLLSVDEGDSDVVTDAAVSCANLSLPDVEAIEVDTDWEHPVHALNNEEL